ncbi:hypothetical protein BMS3Abin01_01242 [bacterium BMS3Abin01]|nr:hypothetical protein BMS3Abin01_01242 [bacterium BMS3Abin01]HDY69732.1 nickel pincer cofactor biosynthesis protein LarC [Actinomycetota bacterium]
MSDNILYFDCFSGVAGDMFVAALLDMGVGSVGFLRGELEKIDFDGWAIEAEPVKVVGIASTRFRVELSDGKQEPRSLSDIQTLISSSSMDENIRSNVMAVFSRVARAEAAAHGETLETVHFHEVGMVDSIIDIVCACLLMDELSPFKVVTSPVALGQGVVDTSHGVMPVPAPATTILLMGVPVVQGAERCELATPTGAALVAYFADEYGPLPAMRLDAVGYGAGSGEKAGPNLLRVLSGKIDVTGEPELVEQQVLLETNIDDSTPEELAYLLERLLAESATDAWLTPVIMKKGRPGVSLSVLCAYSDIERNLDTIFEESSTFGVRIDTVERHCLERRIEKVKTPYGMISVKVGHRHGKNVTMSPEYEDCRRAAAEHGVTLHTVFEAAKKAMQ